jgi:uncharacterized membrane protein
MENYTVKEGKSLAVISYITFIGTIVAFVMNQNKQNSFASFHIRQAIGIWVVALVVNFIQRFSNFSWVDNLLSILVLVLWIIGLIGAIRGQEQRVPLLGDQFQDWFRNIY